LHHATDETLGPALFRLWPNFIAYALSLMVIGIMWQNHQALFRMIRRIDRTTVFWNLLLLGGTAFIPFATSALGSYPTLRPSTFLYGLALTYCATCYNLMLDHLVKARAFLPETAPKTIRQTVYAYRVGWGGYALATLAALFLPILSFAGYIAIAVYYLIPRGVDADIPAGSEA
jgi:uncharacterized membrane protein